MNKDKHNLGKLNLTRLWVLVKIYAKEYKVLVLVTIYQKIKNKTLIYLSKNLNPKVRLRNGKVLDTHFAQTEFGFLDSTDQYTLFCMM